MHNSQNNSPIATPTGPNPFLTSGTCLGCHAQVGAATNIVDSIPQVYHTGSDLAAGNFAYIAGTKGSGASDSKGHNVIDLFGQNSDEALDMAPGNSSGWFASPAWHFEVQTDTHLTCAGYVGCHGNRVRVGSAPNYERGVQFLKGAHHGNVDGKCDTADTVANSYRFLLGIKGLENPTDKWQNASSASHNEYFGAISPYDQSEAAWASCNQCHFPAGSVGTGVKPISSTISGFCASCHGDFHKIGGTEGGIGGDITSPFVRHPTDIVIKNAGEYAAYTTYSNLAPVGRTTVPDNPSAVVTPGSDVVTCLSCHAAHATDYPDMLRWDYNNVCSAGTANSSCGCFVCHTTKDD